jgi:hypothetical protein
MRYSRTALGLAAVVCVLSFGAASAFASEFESTGGATRGLTVSKQEEFRVWPMVVVCPRSVSKGSVAAGKSTSFTTEVKYSLCSTFNGTVKVTVSAGQFQYGAEGTVAITAPITLTPAGLACHYEIPPQAGFTKESIFYSDVSAFNNKKFPNGQQKIQVESALQGMHYTAVGWPCTGPKTPPELKTGKEEEQEGEEGRFNGKIEEEVGGGNLTWIKSL